MIKKIIASILVLLMLIQILPLSVFAEEITNKEFTEEYINENIDETIVDNIESVEEDVYIVSEDTSKRDKTTKHFLMSDGSYNAISYPIPVHYREVGNEKWSEIDNTLIEVEDENDTTFFKPVSSPIDVKFAKNSDTDKLVSYSVNDYDISWSYENRKNGLFKKTAKILKTTKKQTHADTKKIPVDNLDKLNSRAKYNSLYDNVDIEYTVGSEGVKENIILNKKSAQNEFYIRYNIGNLTAVQTNERLITLYDGEKAVVQIDAPYMIDSANVQSDALTFKIIEQKNSILRVRLTADSEWLKTEDREYPVTIDPYIIEMNQHISNDATYISKNASSYPNGSLVVGNNYAYGASRSYLKFSLPSLSAGDMVIGGTLWLYQFSGEYGYSTATGASSMRINVSQVIQAWEDENVICASFPTHNSTIIDFKDVSHVNSMTLRTFDIGKLVKGWYNDEYSNYGICLYSSTESNQTCATFVATDYNNGSHAPIMVVSYINNKGLEDRWTYHSQSLGESGTSYINDCTGNLVVISPVYSTTGCNAPASVSLVYNGYLAGVSGSGNGKAGKGWRFDFQQRIIQITNGSSELYSGLYTNGFRYIYLDADGTEHYFKAKSGSTSVFEDEEGLSYTLTVNGDSTDAKYTLATKAGTKNIFKSDGGIRKICDADGNYYQYVYDNSNKISYIKDGGDRKISFTYDSNGNVKTVTDPAGRKTTLTYTSGLLLDNITYPDGTKTTFSYTETGGKLRKILSISGISLRYSYPIKGNDIEKHRVSKVEELGVNGTEGNFLDISYVSSHCTKFTDRDERTEKFLFDNYGRTVCVTGIDGSGSKYTYSPTSSTPSDDIDKKANKLTSASTKSRYVNNLLKNHSFENSLNNWTEEGIGGSTYLSGVSHLGTSALGIEKTGEGNLKRKQRLNVNTSTFKVGGTYTFSAYVKTTEINSKASIYVNCYDNSGSSAASLGIYQSRLIYDKESQYKRISVTFKVPTGTDFAYFVLSVQGTDGKTYFDCIQVEEGAAANDYNLLENSDFSDASSNVWVKSSGIGTGEGIVSGSFKIAGTPGANKNAYQTVKVNRPASECAFSFGGYAWGNSAPLNVSTRIFSYSVILLFTDGTYQNTNFMLQPYISESQFISGVVKANKANSNKTVESVRLRMVYYDNVNTVNFDNISLNIDETGTSYTYYDNGNLKSAIDNANRNQIFTYDSYDNLITSNYEENELYTYTYNTNGTNKKQLLSAKSDNSNLEIGYAYNEKGNVTSTTAKGTEGKKIVSINAYNGTNLNDLSSTTDSLGNKTIYTYNTTYDYSNRSATGTGTLKSTKDPAGYTTSYTYNSANDLLTKVTGPYPDATVNYTYNNYHCLTDITTVTSSYKFTYDTFRNLQKVSVGGKDLSTNTYEANNGNLTQTKYGNANTVSYEYDSLDRVKKITYNGNGNSAQYSWTYNRNSEIAKYVDGPENLTYNYTYDLSGRLLELYRSDKAYIKTAYDTRNMVTGISYGLGSAKETASYTYSKNYDYAPTTATFTDGSHSYIYYDSLGRKNLETAYSSQGLLFNTWYKYLDNSSDSTKTSGLVSEVLYTAISGLNNISYSYDSRGNITEVKYSDNHYERYEYDALNRLVRADNEKQQKAWVYTYDKNGNILTEKTYHIGFVGQALINENLLSSVTYTYGDTNWGDKLTKYNGKTITYDAIGNPLSYDGKTFTWLGRRLNTYKNGSTTTSYTYNSDGIRTSKTVGSTTTKYFLNGSTILLENRGGNILSYYYDATGKRIAFKYNGNMYYYVYNLQGDVTHIVNSSGSIVGTYQYDAWGKILNLGSLTSIAQVNPFRYRGYYYDNESGLYYLNSRYYSAEWRRFINADSYITTGQGLTSYNMFAYCGNNPIMYVDYSGQSWLVALFAIGCCAVIGGIWGACSNSNLAKTATKKATEKSKEEQVNAQSININNITNQNYSQTKNSYTINNVNNNNMLQQKEVPKLTAGERISNAVIGASLGIAVGGAIVATYAAIGTAIIGSAAVSLPVIGMTGVQAFSWGALAFDSVTMIVLPFFGIIGEPIEYSQSN